MIAFASIGAHTLLFFCWFGQLATLRVAVFDAKFKDKQNKING